MLKTGQDVLLLVVEDGKGRSMMGWVVRTEVLGAVDSWGILATVRRCGKRVLAWGRRGVLFKKQGRFD